MASQTDMAIPPYKWRKRASSFEIRAHFRSILSIYEARRMYVWHARPMYADVHPHARYTLRCDRYALCAVYEWARVFMPACGRE
jgi:hypothetical protein